MFNVSDKNDCAYIKEYTRNVICQSISIEACEKTFMKYNILLIPYCLDDN